MSNLPDSLISLGFPDLGLHVSLGKNLSKTGTNDGALELGRPPGLLLGLLLFDSLPVLSSVKHRPGDLTRIALHKMGSLALGVEEGVDLKNNKRPN